jgi:hypothetical protein
MPEQFEGKEEGEKKQHIEGTEVSSAEIGESRLERYKAFVSEDLEKVGLLVFAITAFSTVLFVVGLNLFSTDADVGAYRQLRSAEILLTLAATGLIVAVIGRAQSPFVLAFGVFLIGALIVPSRDIVKFALIASGSDRSYETFFRSGGSGADLAGRSTDVANKILTELSQARFMEPLSPEDRKRAVQIVESEVRKEREITLLEQVRGRGAMEALKAAADDVERWVYKYGEEEKFIEDLRYLRSEDLISFAYEDLETIKITALGRTVLDRASAEAVGPSVSLASRQPDARNQRLQTTATSQPLRTRNLCPPDAMNLPDATVELLSEEGHKVQLELLPSYARFSVKESASYQIDVKVDVSSPNNQVDPELILMKINSDGGCTLVGADDDGGTGLDSSLLTNLELGDYLIVASSISFDEGFAVIFLRKN